MSSQIIAAIIAAIVSSASVLITVTAQNRARRETLDAQHEQMERTFEEQRQQLERTFEEQRQQLEGTFEEQRTRILSERLRAAAKTLDSNEPRTAQLAGVHAMAELADDWEEERQACVNVLCAYLRGQENRAFLDNRDVGHAIIRVITEHLRKDKGFLWEDLEFDFTSAVFNGADFSGIRIHEGTMIFDNVEFASGMVSFHGAKFSKSTLNFRGARFTDGTVSFDRANFFEAAINFQAAQFHGGMLAFNGELCMNNSCEQDFCGTFLCRSELCSCNSVVAAPDSMIPDPLAVSSRKKKGSGQCPQPCPWASVLRLEACLRIARSFLVMQRSAVVTFPSPICVCMLVLSTSKMLSSTGAT